MDTSFSRWLLLALGLHAGVALAGRSLPALGAEPAARAAESYELSVVVEPAPEPARPGEPGPEPRAGLGRASAPAPPAPGPARSGRGSVEGPAAEGPGAGTPDADGPAPAPAAAASAERPVDLGLGGLWARPGLPDRPRSGWRTGADAAGGLGSGLEARDQARGLGRGGVVATLARGAAITRGPSEGEATFSVHTDREGKVTSVSLGDARGGSWSAVLSELRRSLAQKRLRVPPGSNGLAVQVLVRARVQLPSGSRPGEAIRAQGAGAEFDVADIGARPARVVSARVTSERLL